MKWLFNATRRLVRCRACGWLAPAAPHCGQCGAELPKEA